MSTSHSQNWDPVWLELCMWEQSMWVYVYVNPVVSLRLFSQYLLAPLALKTFLYLIQHSFLSPDGRNLMKTLYLRLNVSKPLSFCLLSSYDYLCWEGAIAEGTSLIMTEIGTDLCSSLVWPMEVPGRRSALVFLKPKHYEKGLDCVEAESIP